MNIVQRKGLYFDKGRQNTKIDRVVMHWIVGDLDAADSVFLKVDAPINKRVSAHYAVGEKEIRQYIDEADTAWHAGVLAMNRRSLGIEHRGGPNMPITEDTYKLSAQLLSDICERHDIPLDRAHIIKHSEVKPTQCPGTLDLDRLIEMAKNIDSDSCENQLTEMRASRDKWKRQAKEDAEKHADEIKNKNEDYERLQKTLTETNFNLTNANVQITGLQKQLKGEEELTKEVSYLRKQLSMAQEIIDDTLIDNIELQDKVNRLLQGFSSKELFKEVFKRLWKE